MVDDIWSASKARHEYLRNFDSKVNLPASSINQYYFQINNLKSATSIYFRCFYDDLQGPGHFRFPWYPAFSEYLNYQFGCGFGGRLDWQAG